ncbi:conserved hypothetical protein [Talaromyces stipitatus ATCC 10500]|uniref:C2H2-type domain-containing protein n=1 Tax=Talaromyces stipitatus (strain ATCC 10500 / CBS 375.48 / QM 6759 / NRRL 1006) TaxID=441959 RepID=B8MCC4_TALSN|nr:uncharacterized protein TSTA_122990 [Talaromyces stipitatus ATCC 10500]EED18570.1 conserved hypothetical protein [Talaromyces stipitatus ATCC 10500]
MDTISKVLNQCLKDFTALTTSDDLTRYETEVPHRRWLDELGRLRVWSGNIGAHQVGQSSLDYRLRDASHLKSEAIKLLSRMLRVLQDVKEVANEGRDENVDIELEDEDDNMDDMTEIQQLYQSLVDIINLLFQISMAIRKPADHDRLLNMKTKNESYFEPWAQQHISHKYPEAGNGVVSRLSAAMARQKAILKYRERHRAKLGKGLFEYIGTDSTKLSETEATEMATGNDQLHFLETASNSGLSQTSYATSLITTQDAISIPNPPRKSRDKKPFECPYCFHVISIKHKKDWARHVFRDLMPYACLSRDCPTPSKLYESRHQWSHHMREIHPEVAAAQNGFTCPLCQINVQPPASFEKHVGRHLEELALFVLPRTDLSEEDNSEVSSPATSIIAVGNDSDEIIGSEGIKSDVGPHSSHGVASGDDSQHIRSLESEQFGPNVDESLLNDKWEEQCPEQLGQLKKVEGEKCLAKDERNAEYPEEILEIERLQKMARPPQDVTKNEELPELLRRGNYDKPIKSALEARELRENAIEMKGKAIEECEEQNKEFNDPSKAEHGSKEYEVVTVTQPKNPNVHVQHGKDSRSQESLERTATIWQDAIDSVDDSSVVNALEQNIRGHNFTLSVGHQNQEPARIADEFEVESSHGIRTGGVDDTTAYRYTNASEIFEQELGARVRARLLYGQGVAKGQPMLSRRLSESGIFSKKQEILFQELVPENPGQAAQSKRRAGRAPVYDANVSDQGEVAYYSSDSSLENHGGGPRRPTYPSYNRLTAPQKEPTSSDKQEGIEARPSTDTSTSPRGILEPPQAKFPEEPNPVHEGVTPLKDALEKGVPARARWTKIDRRLVNPAALEAGLERFEERPEYVIVLRVLTKEEIQAYALKTQEIRDARYRRRRRGE